MRNEAQRGQRSDEHWTESSRAQNNATIEDSPIMIQDRKNEPTHKVATKKQHTRNETAGNEAQSGKIEQDRNNTIKTQNAIASEFSSQDNINRLTQMRR